MNDKETSMTTPSTTNTVDEHFRILYRFLDGSVVVYRSGVSAETAEGDHKMLEESFKFDKREAWIESQVLSPWRKRYVTTQGISRAHNYEHKELTDVLNVGPEPETEKFHLKVIGKGRATSHWLSITAEQLATIAAVLDGPE